MSLGLLSALYLTSFSNFEINLLMKDYLVIIPIQLLALVYGIYIIYSKKS